jgi:hypothetical protein
MKTFNQAVLVIVNLIGAMTIIMGLIVPFIITADNTAALITGIWMLVTGFVIWYLSNKQLEKDNPSNY